jgi:hypothetical protein
LGNGEEALTWQGREQLTFDLKKKKSLMFVGTIKEYIPVCMITTPQKKSLSLTMLYKRKRLNKKMARAISQECSIQSEIPVGHLGRVDVRNSCLPEVSIKYAYFMTKVFNVETLSQRKRQTLASYC